MYTRSNLVFGNIKYLNNICPYLLNKMVFVRFCQVLLFVFVYNPFFRVYVNNPPKK